MFLSELFVRLADDEISNDKRKEMVRLCTIDARINLAHQVKHNPILGLHITKKTFY